MSYGHNKTTKRRQGWAVKEPVKRTANKNQRVDLAPEQYDRMIEQKGVIAKVYRTTYCPKVKSVDGAEHEIDCTLCNGSGFIDVDPICCPVVVTTQELHKLPNIEGMVDGNTVLMTFPIGVELQYFTKIELEDFTEVFPQRVLRAPGTLTDVLKYKAVRVNVLIDYDGVRYYQDQDFQLDINGNVTWLATGSRPADNKPYSIHYECHTQYRAKAAAHVNRFSQYLTEDGKAAHQKFPEQWYCTKEFFPKRTDFDGNETEQGPYDSHQIVEES